MSVWVPWGAAFLSIGHSDLIFFLFLGFCFSFVFYLFTGG